MKVRGLVSSMGGDSAEHADLIVLAEAAGAEIYNTIVIYTLLVLIRSPGIKGENGAKDREQLELIYAQFMDPEKGLRCLPHHLEEAEAIIKVAGAEASKKGTKAGKPANAQGAGKKRKTT